MKLPSVDHLVREGRAAASRFPLALACALASALFAVIAVDGQNESSWIRLLAATSLGLPLFVALTLAAERHGLRGIGRWGARGAGLVLLLLFWWRWPDWSHDVQTIRYFHLSAGLHLSAAVAAHVGVEELRGFWQFNRALFLRFLIGAVYAAVLFGGLAIALAGIDNLLGVDVAGETYARLWILIAFVCHPWFTLAGIPRDFAALERRTDYPGGLRAFAQYVLLPLVAVYLVILTAYLVRVVATRVWPSGWIGYLVSALAALGILSLLLIHPERDRPDARWIDGYARAFWIAILPPTAMLLLAAWKRIDQYGVTERRYLLTVLAVWLAVVAVVHAVSRSRNIKWIPLSLAAIAFVTFLGPWSAYAMSRRSQTARLEGLLVESGILADGRVTPTTAELPEESRREITATLGYLTRVHGTAGIDPWFGGRLAAIDTIADGTRPSQRWDAERRAALIMRHMGVRPLEPGVLDPEYESFAAGGPPRARDITGFEYALTGIELTGTTLTVDGEEIVIAISPSAHRLVMRRAGRAVLEAPLDSLLARARGEREVQLRGVETIDPEVLTLDLESPGVVARAYIERLTIRRVDGAPRIENAHGDLYWRWRDTVPR